MWLLTAAQWNIFGFMVSFLVAIGVVALLSSNAVLYTFVVLGQAHFVITYLYQAKAGKIGWKYIALYILAAGLLVYSLATLSQPQLWTLMIAGSIFAVHFFVDEMFINGVKLTNESRLLGGAFIFLYAALLLRAAYGVDQPLGIGALAFAACTPLLYKKMRSRTVSTPEMFFLCCVVILLFILFVPVAISVTSALGFIILLHYMRWYLYYFFRFGTAPDTSRFRRYIVDVLFINAVVLTCFLAYLYVPQFSVLVFVFGPAYFYGWTILHVLFSIRISQKRPTPST